MSPLQIRVALHYYYSPTDFPEENSAVKEAISVLLAAGLLKSTGYTAPRFRGTEGLIMYAQRLCDTPFPEMKWTYEGVA